MTNKRVVISQDYDGGFSLLNRNGRLAAGIDLELKKNKAFYGIPANKHFVKRLKKIPDQYQDFLTKITAEADAVSVYVGSDRQSYELDVHNSAINRNQSVFAALQHLCKMRTSADVRWKFEPFLMADPVGHRGEALARMVRKEGETDDTFQKRQLHAPPTKRKTEADKPDKIPLIIAQMWDAFRQYPGEEIDFHFNTHSKEAIQDICDNLKTSEIPPGMTLKISRFDYVDLIQGEEGALGMVKAIKSSHHTPKVAEQIKAAEKTSGVRPSEFQQMYNAQELHYKHTHYENEYSEEKPRDHGKYTVDAKNVTNLRDALRGLKGDTLKTQILADFRTSLEGKSKEEQDQTIEHFKKGPEYKILTTAQGWYTKHFKIQTSSAKAVEEIINEMQSQASTNAPGSGRSK